MGELTEMVRDALTDRRAKEVAEAKAVDREAKAKERAELDVKAAALQAEIDAKENQLAMMASNTRAEAMRTEMAKIEADRRARGKRELSSSKLTRRAARRIAKAGRP